MISSNASADSSGEDVLALDAEDIKFLEGDVDLVGEEVAILPSKLSNDEEFTIQIGQREEKKPDSTNSKYTARDFAAPFPTPKLAKEETFCKAKMENPTPFKLIVVLFAVIFCVGKSTEKESNDPLVKAFQTLKEDEKTHFIAYFLALGLQDKEDKLTGSQTIQPITPILQEPVSFIKDLYIPSEKIEKFEQMKIPTESVRKLLQWTKSKFNLTTTNVEDLLRNKECKGCVLLPDIGGLCCPW